MPKRHNAKFDKDKIQNEKIRKGGFMYLMFGRAYHFSNKQMVELYDSADIISLRIKITISHHRIELHCLLLF